jgi:hypothetical protein
VFRDAKKGNYQDRLSLDRKEKIMPLSFPYLEIHVEDLFVKEE